MPKYKLSVWQRKNLHALFSNIQMSGGISLGQIDQCLKIKNKLEYTGKASEDTDTELELEPADMKLIKQKAFAASGWPVNKEVKQLKDRLEKYAGNGQA